MKRGRLRWLGRIDRYVLSLFLSSYATAFLLVVGLYLILDMAQNLDEHLQLRPDGTRPPVLLVVQFYLMHLPFLFLQVAPFVTLVAGLFTVGKLVRHNETVAALSAGTSAQRLLAPIVVCSLLIGAAMFALRETASARLADRRDTLLHLLDHHTLDRVYENLWLRDGQGNVVRLGKFRPRPADGGPPLIEDLDAHLFSAARWASVTADRAVWEPDADPPGWRLIGGVRQMVEGAQRTEPVTRLEGFEFTPELVLTFWRAREAQLELSFAEAAEMGRRDPDNGVYQTLLQYHVTFPLGNLVLVLIGLPLLMRHERGRGTRTAAAAFGLCITYFAADFVCRSLGIQGALDPALAAWLPILLFGSLGIALYDSMRS